MAFWWKSSLFYGQNQQNHHFWHHCFWPQKSVNYSLFLDISVCWPGTRIRKKPGEPLPAAETRGVAGVVRTLQWCARCGVPGVWWVVDTVRILVHHRGTGPGPHYDHFRPLFVISQWRYSGVIGGVSCGVTLWCHCGVLLLTVLTLLLKTSLKHGQKCQNCKTTKKSAKSRKFTKCQKCVRNVSEFAHFWHISDLW